MRYWVYLSEKVSGPYEPKELKGLEGFDLSVLVCPEGLGGEGPSDWRPAGEIKELSSPEADAKPDLFKLYEECLENLQHMSRDLEQARRIKTEPGMVEKIKKLQEELYESHKILEGMKINNLELERKLSAQENQFERLSLERRKEREDFEKEKKRIEESVAKQALELEGGKKELESVWGREEGLKVRISELERELKNREAALASAQEAIESLHKSIRDLRPPVPPGKAPAPPKNARKQPGAGPAWELETPEIESESFPSARLALAALLFSGFALVAWGLYQKWPQLAAFIEARLEKPEMIAKMPPADMEIEPGLTLPAEPKPSAPLPAAKESKPPEIAKPKAGKAEKKEASAAEESGPIEEEPQSLPGLESEPPPEEEDSAEDDFILPGIPRRKSNP